MKWEDLTEDTVTVQTEQGLLTVLTDDDEIGRHIYNAREYQHGYIRSILDFMRTEGKLPPKGTGTVLDIGAHIGAVSIGMVLDGEFANAIAVEPGPRNYEALVKNIEQNNLTDRFQLFNYALSDKDSAETLELSVVNGGDHRVRRPTETPERHNESAREIVAIEGRTIDSLGLDASLVWMDTQGFEGHIIKGGKSLFDKDIPVNAEIWPYGVAHSGMELEEFVDIITSSWTHYCYIQDGFAKHTMGGFGALVDEIYRGIDNAHFRDMVLLK